MAFETLPSTGFPPKVFSNDQHFSNDLSAGVQKAVQPVDGSAHD